MQLWFDVWRYTRDEGSLRAMLPLLRRTVNFYLHYAITNSTDGSIHMPPTFSPEYAVAPDCNYDNALLRNAVTSLVEAITVLGVDDPRMAEYQRLAANLTKPPQVPRVTSFPWIPCLAATYHICICADVVYRPTLLTPPPPHTHTHTHHHHHHHPTHPLPPHATHRSVSPRSHPRIRTAGRSGLQVSWILDRRGGAADKRSPAFLAPLCDLPSQAT
jgi:hypothetical protein